MATIGIFYFLDGLGQTLWGSDIKRLDIGIPQTPLFIPFFGGTDLLVTEIDLFAADVGAVMVAVLALLFPTTRIGLALRAWADDDQAAQRSDEDKSDLQSPMPDSYATS